MFDLDLEIILPPLIMKSDEEVASHGNVGALAALLLKEVIVRNMCSTSVRVLSINGTVRQHRLGRKLKRARLRNAHRLS